MAQFGLKVMATISQHQNKSLQLRVITSLLAGASCGFVREFLWFADKQRSGAVIVPIAFLLSLTILVRPLVSMRLAIFVSLGGSLGLTIASPLATRAFAGYWGDVPFAWLPFGLLGVWVLSAAICCAAVAARRRMWPVYAPGCCQKCGYDLRSITGRRCPECGAPVVNVHSQSV